MITSAGVDPDRVEPAVYFSSSEKKLAQRLKGFRSAFCSDLFYNFVDLGYTFDDFSKRWAYAAFGAGGRGFFSQILTLLHFRGVILMSLGCNFNQIEWLLIICSTQINHIPWIISPKWMIISFHCAESWFAHRRTVLDNVATAESICWAEET